VLRQYVEWLAVNRTAAEARPAAEELAKDVAPIDVPILLDYVDKAMKADVPGALEQWNSMCNRKVLPFQALNPAAGPVITNGAFLTPPMRRGFDWGLLGEPGSSISLQEGGGIVIQFSGKQAERTGLLFEWIPLAPKAYRLSFEYRVSGNGGATGLHWELMHSGRNLLGGEQKWRSTDWQTGQIEFRSEGQPALPLVLMYERETGMIPWEGALYIRKVEIEALQ
jgi:hypothetical protein